jgi:hypothetical protein
MQVLAIGKWSKVNKRWNMVVALRKPGGSPPPAPTPSGRRTSLRQSPQQHPSK